MTVHKLLFGDGAALYLPFALSRLRALQAINKDGFFSQTFIVEDTTIKVRQVGKQQYITITAGGGFYFEFCTSGKPVLTYPFDAGGFGILNYYDSLVVATNVTALDGNIVTKPFVRENERGMHSQVGYTPQIQLTNQVPRYRELDPKLRNKYFYQDILYSSYAPHSSNTGVGLRNAFMRYSRFNFLNDVGGGQNNNQRDVGYDMIWQFTHGFQNPPTMATIQDSADWPRESGYQKVVSEQYGTREFAITVDAFCRFHIHPISAIGPNLGFAVQNVDGSQIRHVSPIMPSWMFVNTAMSRDTYPADPNFTHMLIDQPDYDWKFNHTGTRACAVVYGRSPYSYDTAYWNSLQNPDTPFTQATFDELVAIHVHDMSSYGIVSTEPTYSPQHYFIGNGVVEARINITLTGTDPNQFTVEVIVDTIRDPNFSPYAALFAGYVWKDITDVGVSAGDMVCVDIEGYGQAVIHAKGTEHILSVKNLTKGTEAFATRGYQVVAIDLSTLSMVLKLQVEDRQVPVNTPMIAGVGGGSQNIFWLRQTFAMWVIHSGLSKGLIFPDTMDQTARDRLTDLAVRNGREFINNKMASEANWEYIPLANPHDGWVDADWNAYRDYWSFIPHFWYNETWVLEDPNVFFHGSGYPTQGYVIYRDAPGGYTPPDLSTIPYRVISINKPWNGTSEHLMLCDNPRWGWNFYDGAAHYFDGVSPFTTFFTHPNGSYCFYNDQFIHNPQGMPAWGAESATASDVDNCQALDIFDVTKLEHCIFDRVHLEVKKAVGTSASLDTSFMDLYNRAVQKGLDDETLQENIKLMSKDDIRGVFTKTINTAVPTLEGDFRQTLELKFTWRGKDWYFYEPGMMGAFVGSPLGSFPPMLCGTFIGLNLQMPWTQAPLTNTFNSYGYPSYVDMNNSSALPIRFCNPLIVMG